MTGTRLEVVKNLLRAPPKGLSHLGGMRSMCSAFCVCVDQGKNSTPKMFRMCATKSSSHCFIRIISVGETSLHSLILSKCFFTALRKM